MLLMKRSNDRAFDQLRDVNVETGIISNAEGSALIKFGNTHVICTASIENSVPRWMKNSNEGWITAEYGMLPRSTHERMGREAARGKQSGRTQEIHEFLVFCRFVFLGQPLFPFSHELILEACHTQL